MTENSKLTISELKKKIGKICGFDWGIWTDRNRNFRKDELLAILRHMKENEAEQFTRNLAGAEEDL